MATTNIYLHFRDQTEAAFAFYKTVFGGDFEGPIGRFGDVPPTDGATPLSATDAQLIMHICLPILGGVKLMGSDAPAAMGFTVTPGNNVHLSLHPDTRMEADRLFTALSKGGVVTMPLKEMFWGDYYGICTDPFGVHWMINCDSKT